MDRLNENIKAYRIKKGYTQNELAEQLHISKQAVSKWETGRGLPDTQIIQDIAGVLGISTDILFNGRRYRKILILNLVFVCISILFIILPLIVSFQRLLNSEVYIFSLNDYALNWLVLTLMLFTLVFLEITYLLYFFGYIRNINHLPLKKSLIIGLVFHVLFTLFGYFIIWLTMVGSTIDHEIVGLISVMGVLIIEIITLVVLSLKLRKEIRS